jgi:hypothetical protein
VHPQVAQVVTEAVETKEHLEQQILAVVEVEILLGHPHPVAQAALALSLSKYLTT